MPVMPSCGMLRQETRKIKAIQDYIAGFCFKANCNKDDTTHAHTRTHAYLPAHTGSLGLLPPHLILTSSQPSALRAGLYFKLLSCLCYSAVELIMQNCAVACCCLCDTHSPGTDKSSAFKPCPCCSPRGTLGCPPCPLRPQRQTLYTGLSDEPYQAAGSEAPGSQIYSFLLGLSQVARD